MGRTIICEESDDGLTTTIKEVGGACVQVLPVSLERVYFGVRADSLQELADINARIIHTHIPLDMGPCQA